MPVPIPVADLFPILDKLLLEALRACSPKDWNRSTLARQWTIKDIAAHLLDGNFRTLSTGRDGYFGEQPPIIEHYRDLVNWLNKLNADWVQASKRMSPHLIIELLESTGADVSQYYQHLDPYAPALFSVAWAGEHQSLNWFHVAREYTEKWHHQAQIREALGTTSPLLEKALFHPFIQTMLQGLPHQYRNTHADDGTELQLNISGEAGGDWTLKKEVGGWSLIPLPSSNPTAVIKLSPELSWKLFTRGIRPGDLTNSPATAFSVSGDRAMADPMLELISVMA